MDALTCQTLPSTTLEVEPDLPALQLSQQPHRRIWLDADVNSLKCHCVVLAQQGSAGSLLCQKSEVQPAKKVEPHDPLSKQLRAEAQPAWQLGASSPGGMRHAELEVQLHTLTTEKVDAGRRPSEGAIVLDVSRKLAVWQCRAASERAAPAGQRSSVYGSNERGHAGSGERMQLTGITVIHSRAAALR